MVVRDALDIQVEVQILTREPKGDKMAESRTSQALSDLLEAISEDVDFDDRSSALVQNAEARLKEYREAADDQLDRAGDLLRNALAQLVQRVNQVHPEQTGRPEVREAVSALADPTPPAVTEARARFERDEADRVRAVEANERYDQPNEENK
jgi:hypothetical protein